MKKSTKTSKINRSLGVKAVLALLLVALWGCDSRNTSVTWTDRNAKLGSIINDSLAIYKNFYNKVVCTQPKFNIQGINDCEYLPQNPGLYLVNYRNKQVYWGDTLDEYMTVLKGHIDDSTVMVIDKNATKYGFWKIGGKPKLVNKFISPNGGGINWIAEARVWKNGNFLFYRHISSELHHWLLDTKTGEVSKFSFTGDDAWLESCIDFKYHKGEVFCVKMDSTGSGNLNLWVDGTITDSLYLNGCEIWETYGWHGPYVLLDLFCLHFYSPNVKEVAWWYGMFDVRKVDYTNQKFDTTFSGLWISLRNDFAFDQDNHTTFNPEDLIVTGGE